MRRLLAAMAVGLGLLIGGALALGTGLRAAHLAAFGLLPGWMAEADPEARLRWGRYQGDLIGLEWRFGGFTRNGPFWRIALTGPQILLEGEARPEAGGFTLQITGGRVAVAGAALEARFEISGGQGRLEASGLGLSLAGHMVEGRRLREQGMSALPPGPARFGRQAGGHWVLELGEAPAAQMMAGDDLRQLLEPAAAE